MRWFLQKLALVGLDASFTFTNILLIYLLTLLLDFNLGLSCCKLYDRCEFIFTSVFLLLNLA